MICRFSQCRAPSAAKWTIEQFGGEVLTPNPRGSPSLEKTMAKSNSCNAAQSGSHISTVYTQGNQSSASINSHVEDGGIPDIRVLRGGWEAWHEKYGAQVGRLTESLSHRSAHN